MIDAWTPSIFRQSVSPSCVPHPFPYTSAVNLKPHPIIIRAGASGILDCSYDAGAGIVDWSPPVLTVAFQVCAIHIHDFKLGEAFQLSWSSVQPKWVEIGSFRLKLYIRHLIIGVFGRLLFWGIANKPCSV